MKITLLGTSFTIQTNEDPEYVEKIVHFYENKVQEVRDSIASKSVDPLKIAILAGILIVDEYFKESQSLQNVSQEIQGETMRVAGKLIEYVDDTLTKIDEEYKSE